MSLFEERKVDRFIFPEVKVMKIGYDKDLYDVLRTKGSRDHMRLKEYVDESPTDYHESLEITKAAAEFFKKKIKSFVRLISEDYPSTFRISHYRLIKFTKEDLPHKKKKLQMYKIIDEGTGCVMCMKVRIFPKSYNPDFFESIEAFSFIHVNEFSKKIQDKSVRKLLKRSRVIIALTPWLGCSLEGFKKTILSHCNDYDNNKIVAITMKVIKGVHGILKTYEEQGKYLSKSDIRNWVISRDVRITMIDEENFRFPQENDNVGYLVRQNFLDFIGDLFKGVGDIDVLRLKVDNLIYMLTCELGKDDSEEGKMEYSRMIRRTPKRIARRKKRKRSGLLLPNKRMKFI